MIRLSSLVAKIEDRAIAAYAAAKPAALARASALHDELIIRIEAAKHARAFYAQVVTDVKAKR